MVSNIPLPQTVYLPADPVYVLAGLAQSLKGET